MGLSNQVRRSSKEFGAISAQGAVLGVSMAYVELLIPIRDSAEAEMLCIFSSPPMSSDTC